MGYKIRGEDIQTPFSMLSMERGIRGVAENKLDFLWKSCQKNIVENLEVQLCQETNETNTNNNE